MRLGLFGHATRVYTDTIRGKLVVLNLLSDVYIASQNPITVLLAPVNWIVAPSLVIKWVRICKELSAVEVVLGHSDFGLLKL